MQFDDQKRVIESERFVNGPFSTGFQCSDEPAFEDAIPEVQLSAAKL